MRQVLSATLLMISTQVFAASYNLPPANESLIGKVQYTTANTGDNVVNIAKRYDIGRNDMENANPYLNMEMGFLAGTPLQIPTKHLIPNHERDGIIINLPEMRLYYFPPGTNQVVTYPIGIGKIGKTTPISNAHVVRKTKNPKWYPPDSIRQFNLEQGIILPKVMPAGPDNPLGPYAIYMSIPTYLFHSTPFPESIGMRASFGCIRMYESDIQEFYPSVQKGTPITIINSPIKLGWQNNLLYMEAYEPLEEHIGALDASLPGTVHTIAMMSKDQPTLVDWQLVSYITEERDGIPHDIGMIIR